MDRKHRVICQLVRFGSFHTVVIERCGALFGSSQSCRPFRSGRIGQSSLLLKFFFSFVLFLVFDKVIVVHFFPLSAFQIISFMSDKFDAMVADFLGQSHHIFPPFQLSCIVLNRKWEESSGVGVGQISTIFSVV